MYIRIQSDFILMVEKFPLFHSQGVFPRIPGRDMYYPSDTIDRVGQLLNDSHGRLSLEEIGEIFQNSPGTCDKHEPETCLVSE